MSKRALRSWAATLVAGCIVTGALVTSTLITGGAVGSPQGDHSPGDARAGVTSAPAPAALPEPAAVLAGFDLSASGLPRDGLLLAPIPGLTRGWHLAPRQTAIPVGTRLLLARGTHPKVALAWEGAREIARGERWSVAEVVFEEAGPRDVRTRYRLPSGQVIEHRIAFEAKDVEPESIRLERLRLEAAPISRGGTIAKITPLARDRYATSRRQHLRVEARTQPEGFEPLVEWTRDGEARLVSGAALSAHYEQPRTGRIAAALGASEQRLEIEIYEVTIRAPEDALTRLGQGEAVTLEAVTSPPGFEEQVSWIAADGSGEPEAGRGSTFTLHPDTLHLDTLHLDGATARGLEVLADDAVFPSREIERTRAFRTAASLALSLDPEDSSCAAGEPLAFRSLGLEPLRLTQPLGASDAGGSFRSPVPSFELGAFSKRLGRVVVRAREDRPSISRLGLTEKSRSRTSRESVPDGIDDLHLDLFLAVELRDLGLTLHSGEQAWSLAASPAVPGEALLAPGTALSGPEGGSLPLFDQETGQVTAWLCGDFVELGEEVPPDVESPPGEDWFHSEGTAAFFIYPEMLGPLGDLIQGELFVEIELSSEGLPGAQVFLDPPPYVPGQVIRTEMASLELRGHSPLVGEVILREREDMVSEGVITAIEVDADGNFIAGQSSFNLFVEFILPEIGMTVHSGMEPFLVNADYITGLPPEGGGEYEHDEDDGDKTLYDANTFQPIGELFYSNHWIVNSCAADIDIDSDNNNGTGPPDRSPAEDAIELTPPGKYIALNEDDDDLNGVRDLAEENVGNPAENDLVPIVLELAPNTAPGFWRLTYSQQVEVYDMTANPPAIIPSGTVFPVPMVPNPKTLMVEGVQVSQALGDVSLVLDYDCDGDGQWDVQDKVVATVVRIDLDVDSDNTNGTGAPDRNQTEEDLEDQVNPADSGKYFAVNRDNDDDPEPYYATATVHERIDDYGDGYNRDGAMSTDDVNPQENDFVQAVLEVPAPVDLTVARVRFLYDDSDPAALAYSDAGANAPPNRRRITPAAGHLRIWNRQGNQGRNSASITATPAGNFVPDNVTITAQQLGLTNDNRTMTLYLEGIDNSAGLGQDPITVELDPDGAGPAGWVSRDLVRTTVVDVEFRETAAERGFDGTINPRGLMVPLPAGGTNTTRVLISPQVDIRFRSTQVARATVPAGAQNANFNLTVTSVAARDTLIEVFVDTPDQLVINQLRAYVLPRKTIRTQYHQVRDTAAPPAPQHVSARGAAAAGPIFTDMNEVWERQANIRYRPTPASFVADPAVPVNLGAVIQFFAGEWARVVANENPAFAYDVFFVWEYEQDRVPDDNAAASATDAGTLPGLSLVEDNLGSPARSVFSHEAGHHINPRMQHFAHNPANPGDWQLNDNLQLGTPTGNLLTLRQAVLSNDATP